jgi:hypothetical protein
LCWVFFKIGSWELFVQAGLELQYSWSLPPGVAKVTGMSHHCLAIVSLLISSLVHWIFRNFVFVFIVSLYL